MIRRCLPLAALSALALPLAAPEAARADLVTYASSGDSVAIPDGEPSGVSLDVEVADALTIDQFRSVTVAMGRTHGWAGDLIATLTHLPSGATITLFNRVGKTSNAETDGDAAFFGDSSNFGGTYTFSNVLAPTGLPRLVDDAILRGETTLINNGTYAPTTNLVDGMNAGEVITDLNAAFDGLDAAGTWRLTLSDNAAEDVGSVAGFSFTFATSARAVPEPGGLALLGAGLAYLLAGRRRAGARGAIAG